MESLRRILVLGSSFGGGNWPPLAAVTVGLHRTGHAVKCYGDATIARNFAAAAAGVEIVPAEHDTVPMVLIPWDRDQPGVAARAAALRIAEVIPRQDLTEARLSAAIRKVLGTARYQEEAARIAGCLQGQDTVASACARIEEFMDKN